MRHTGYCIGGNLLVRMTGTDAETRIRQGTSSKYPPGHDAFVDGPQRVELILFAPPEQGAASAVPPPPKGGRGNGVLTDRSYAREVHHHHASDENFLFIFRNL